MDFEKIYEKVAEKFVVPVEEVKEEMVKAMEISDSQTNSLDCFLEMLAVKVAENINELSGMH